jgi:hypothetical protein
MNTVQATAYGAKLLVHMLIGKAPVIDSHSTANERLDIEPSARPTITETMKLGILMAGNLGHVGVTGNRGIALTSPQNHLATDASLFGPVPFCLRTIDNDLPLEQRNRYALRKQINIGGVEYFAYYGLRIEIDPDEVNVEMVKITTEDGQSKEEPFVPDTSNLYPDPITLPVAGAVTATDVKIAVKAIFEVPLSENDIAEYVNVAKIMNGGDERYAIISEFALCTGADRTIQVTSTQGQVNFLESIGTQVYCFAADYKAVYMNDQTLNIRFDIGNQVPLLGTASIPTLKTIP